MKVEVLFLHLALDAGIEVFAPKYQCLPHWNNEMMGTAELLLTVSCAIWYKMYSLVLWLNIK